MSMSKFDIQIFVCIETTYVFDAQSGKKILNGLCVGSERWRVLGQPNPHLSNAEIGLNEEEERFQSLL